MPQAEVDLDNASASTSQTDEPSVTSKKRKDVSQTDEYIEPERKSAKHSFLLWLKNLPEE